MRTQTLAATQRRRGAGQAAGSGGTTSLFGFSAGGAGGDTTLWCGGMKMYTHQGALSDSLHGRGGGFYVAGARVSCRVVSINGCSCVPVRYEYSTTYECSLLVQPCVTPGT